MTDGNDLDGQLYQQFCAAKDLLKQAPEQAESREQLREMLAARKSGGIIFTTIQKFSLEEQESNHPILCHRKNVVVITDEVHRSQYGTKAKLVDGRIERRSRWWGRSMSSATRSTCGMPCRAHPSSASPGRRSSRRMRTRWRPLAVTC